MQNNGHVALFPSASGVRLPSRDVFRCAWCPDGI